MDREQMLWRRPSRDERRQQLSDDLRRISSFLTVVVAEAEHLALPTPANASEILASLDAWHDQLRAHASGS